MTNKTLARTLRTSLFIILLSISFLENADCVESINVAGITNKTPIEFKMGNLSQEGIYVDLWKVWSLKTGIVVNYKITTRDEAVAALQNGTVDVIMGYKPSNAELNFSATENIYLSSIYIYHNGRISSAENLKDLTPYKIGVTAELADDLIKLNPEIIFTIQNTVTELIKASEQGEINVFLAESALTNHELRKLGLWRKFVQSAEPVFKIGASAAVRADNKELLRKINSGFAMITDTERLVVERTWTGGNFKYRIPWGFVATIIVIVLVIGGVAIVWYWNFQLHRRITSATKELTMLKEDAEAANVTKSRFLDNISHELRTPLTLILAPVEDAIKGKPLGNAALEMIQRNSRNLLSLINDLLDLSRMRAGMMTFEVSETDLCAAVKLYCAEMESAAERRGIILSFSIPDEPAIAFIDTKRFSRIISNFFSNSFKFTENGGKINLAIEKDPDSIILKFSDTGRGIPSSRIDYIFDRFNRVETPETRSFEGTGIGLAIVKEITELHGGSVSVKSRYIDDYPEDHGTEFTVRIPSGIEHFSGRDEVKFTDNPGSEFRLPIARVINSSPDQQLSTNAINKKFNLSDDLPSLLIVEDNNDMRSFLELLLAEDYCIYTASNGLEALDILRREEAIDLIVSDIMMPQMDGHELIMRMRSDDRFKGIPVIFLTARDDALIKQEGLELGAVDYVTKPFSSEELKLRVRNQMNLRVIQNNLQRKNNELIAKLAHHMESKKTPVSGDLSKKIESICEFIHINFTDDLTRENLAAASEMNPDTFSRVFNQHTGQTLTDYITGLRIEEAKKRLAATHEPVTRICMDTGFDSIRTFNRAFKKFAGKTPGEYQNDGV